jgi:DNA-binding MarR family transcriptional regulator
MRSAVANSLSHSEYSELADFRYQILRFLRFSENAAIEEGLEPRQHQALLAMKAMPPGTICTIGSLAERLFLRHQSAVGLVDRLVRRKLVIRSPGKKDRRQVTLALTELGETRLRNLSVTHRAELGLTGPQLARALRAIIRRKQPYSGACRTGSQAVPKSKKANKNENR